MASDSVPIITCLSCLLVLLCALPATSNAKPDVSLVRMSNVTGNASLPHPWLKTVLKRRDRQRGCRFRPWICNQGQPRPLRMRCCRNRCVDVTTDPNHCGLCGIRCPFTWNCCRGLCRNININPRHCGRCFHRCPFGVPCLFGMCAYAGRLPPRRPFPFPREPPRRMPPEPRPRSPKKGDGDGDGDRDGAGARADST